MKDLQLQDISIKRKFHKEKKRSLEQVVKSIEETKEGAEFTSRAVERSATSIRGLFD